MPPLTAEQKRENLNRLLASLSPEIRIPLGAQIMDVMASGSGPPLWAGAPPPPFDVFCELIDGCPLHPRQYEAFARAGVLSPEFLFDQNRIMSEFLILWGKGCMSGDTLLTDQETGRR